MRLRKRAEEIVDLMKRTEADFLVSGDTITGEIRIGGGETPAVALIADAIEEVQSEYPLITFKMLLQRITCSTMHQFLFRKALA